MPRKSKRQKILTSIDAVVDQLGGPSEVARICERPPQSVTGWRTRGIFPTVLYPPIRRHLKRKKFKADPSLFRFEQAYDLP